jgi:hypothetical protein
METIKNIELMTSDKLEKSRMKVASKDWLYETGIRGLDGNYSNIFTSKDEKKVHKEEKQGERNYTCRYRKENKFLVIEYYEFGVWN